jgi:RimJ/RimL family protein N-acetyltransferase
MHRIDTPRLSLHPVAASDGAALLALFRMRYVRRFLFDDREMEEAWVRERIADSEAMFAARGFGLWLFGPPGAPPVGFAGFILHEGEPVLLYGQAEGAAGQGYAREAAEAALRRASERGLGSIRATVDEANTRSRRLLEALGFSPYKAEAGPQGTVLYLERPAET